MAAEPLEFLPHSIEAEQAVLGSLLIKADAWPLVARLVKSGDFIRADHRAIFASIAALASRGTTTDLVTVSDHLRQVGQLEQAGGQGYLVRLMRETASAVNVETYAQTVRDRSAARRLANFSEQTRRAVADSRGATADELMADAMDRLLTLRGTGGNAKGLVASSDLARELIDDLDRRREMPRGLNLGLPDFDALTCGLEPGDLVVIAGRPGLGKTSILVTVAQHVAATLPVAVFSAEMPSQQLMRRCVALRSGIAQNRLRRPERLSDDDWARLMPAVGSISELKLFVDDSPLPPLAHIRAECYALKARHGLGLVLIDYVQLVKGPGKNRYEQLLDVAYGCKAIAKELAVPVIVLAQLNRGVESRDNKRPHISDLRDCGGIEEAADIIGLLYSESYYDREFPMPDILECEIAKNRNGEHGGCLWHFAGDRSLVRTLDEGAVLQYRKLRAQSRKQPASDL